MYISRDILFCSVVGDLQCLYRSLFVYVNLFHLLFSWGSLFIYTARPAPHPAQGYGNRSILDGEAALVIDPPFANSTIRQDEPICDPLH